MALERMTTRVRSQQQDMNALIAELREALRLKTRLINLEQELEVARRIEQVMREAVGRRASERGPFRIRVEIESR